MPGSIKALKIIKPITMRQMNYFNSSIFHRIVLVGVLTIGSGAIVRAQDVATNKGTATVAAADSTQQEAPVKEKPVKKKSYVKNTFYGERLIDEQTVMVPIKGTLLFDLEHRFGTVNNGASDLFGIFAGANMRLGMGYVPLKNLEIGLGVDNYNMQVDGSLKYALLRQTKDNSMPVSVTYYGLAAMDTRKRSSTLPIVETSDRFNFFNQLLIARKINERLSLQAGVSLTHFNNVPGYKDAEGNIQPTLNNNHFAFNAGGKYNITPHTAIIVNYDQPLTQHPMNNPHPNLSAGLEMQTSGHTFQVFVGNYGYTLPTDNNMLNQNDFTKGQFLIGFNISRLWNF